MRLFFLFSFLFCSFFRFALSFFRFFFSRLFFASFFASFFSFFRFVSFFSFRFFFFLCRFPRERDGDREACCCRCSARGEIPKIPKIPIKRVQVRGGRNLGIDSCDRPIKADHKRRPSGYQSVPRAC